MANKSPNVLPMKTEENFKQEGLAGGFGRVTRGGLVYAHLYVC